ncbi:TIGR03986 family CRISPR-associated RAMP protein [Anaerovibrio sp. RM50]|uniref:TIGR03986 family type III CRISPR-associated RAMP protein n=1 Tax=Anaerovibrio sp. RM50 TaxID=1200557 RepID=UPI0004809475|nr:TIGR03986 family CRISPR-associated RAMP protein [Anaerovibrio sp. RM50]
MGESMEEMLARLKRDGIGSKVEHKSTDYSRHTGKDKPGYNKSHGGNNSGFRPNEAKPRVNDFSKEAATAPYNFITLPAKALASGLDECIREANNAASGYEEYIAKNKVISGYIDLELETLTPLFIQGEGSLPYMLGNKPVLPGSSLRGMIKNIFKIITMGNMRAGEDFFDRHVFYRRIMASKDKDYQWAHELKDMYLDRLKSEEKSTVKPGFIIKVGAKYYVVPVSRDYKDTIKHYESAVGKYGAITKTKDSDVKWHGTSAYILTGKLGINNKFEHGLFETIEQYEAFKADCRKRGDKKSLLKMGKQMVRYIKLEDAHWNDRTEINFKEYQLDNNRGGVDLLSKAKMMETSKFAGKVNIPKDIKSIAPCYYVPAQGTVDLFGHGQCFRIPYKHSIGEIVEKSYKEYSEDMLDYTDAVFGRSPDFASRVYFEDAMPVDDVKPMQEFPAHPLLQPNPTSFQLYLKQDIGKQLKNWDSDGAEIRGYKMYWHQANGKADMEASPEELAGDKTPEGNKKPEDKIQCRPMRPIPANTKFSSRLRFKNLLPEELGALLLTLDLDQRDNKIAFKLGKGKSIGLGSVRLSDFNLKIENDDAYSGFLQGDAMAEVCKTVDDLSVYKQKFRDAIPTSQQSDWQHIMDELVAMMNYDDNTALTGWQRETSPMRGVYTTNKFGKQQFEINYGFIDRRALPTALNVVERARK